MNAAIYSLVLALAVGHAGAQPKGSPDQLDLLPSKSPTPIFTATIRGKQYRFVLDTAASAAMVSSRLVKALSLRSMGNADANDSSHNPNVKVRLYRLDGLQAGHSIYNNILVSADPSGQDSGPLSDVDGILPLSTFGEREVTIDLPGRHLVIGADAHLKSKLAKSPTYTDNHGCPVLQMRLGGVRSAVRLDSGSEMGLSIPSSMLPKLHMIGAPKFVGRARTMFRTFDINQVKVSDEVRIGGVAFANDGILINDIFPEPNLGSRAMLSHRFTFDQRNHRILIE